MHFSLFDVFVLLERRCSVGRPMNEQDVNLERVFFIFFYFLFSEMSRKRDSEPGLKFGGVKGGFLWRAVGEIPVWTEIKGGDCS